MEVISFYWPNILAAMVLVVILGRLGIHLVARNQSLEVILLGQSFQSGILVGALVMSYIEKSFHNEHGIHLESIISLIFAAIIHFFYLKLSKNYRTYKTEIALVMFVLLVSFAHFIVSVSPIVEFHMIKAAVGDIVTISRFESFVILLIFILTFFFLQKREAKFFERTIDLALFNKPSNNKKELSFTIVVYLIIFLSVHKFGTLFTMAVALIPALSFAMRGIERKYFKNLLLVNCLTVPLSFFLLNYWDRIPTTVIIVFVCLINSSVFYYIKSKVDFKKVN